MKIIKTFRGEPVVLKEKGGSDSECWKWKGEVLSIWKRGNGLGIPEFRKLI